ncbi:peroxidase family protein [Nodosilinea sp. PGN35]|uniref:peroxidase family protein n=1 Tax=Nodosilinea sp. PGN35 TaxID=3020489 RepID=UPI0023B34388|nr:peroxidase family protein [Nodosilinea sp. TSF1-S3]MDF0369663.1 peroxidase family protein [Nodosilinea sp. TSF1-S3]
MNGNESLNPSSGASFGAPSSHDSSGLGINETDLTSLGLSAQSNTARLLPVTPQVLPLTPSPIETEGFLVNPINPTTAFSADAPALPSLTGSTTGEDELIGQSLVVSPDSAVALSSIGGIVEDSILLLERLLDIYAPRLNASLTTDSGISGSDKITNDASISGTVIDYNTIVRFDVGLDNAPVGQYVSILDTLQSDRRFNLTASRINAIAGGQLADGAHTLKFIAADNRGNVSNPFTVAFTLDTIAPGVTLLTPLEGGDHSTTARLIGEVQETGSGLGIAQAIVDGQSTTVQVGSDKQFSQALNTNGLTVGNHQLVLNFADKAGNATTQTIDFQVANDFILGPTGSQGWVAETAETILIGEENSFVTATTLDIDLGQSAGSRTLRFDLDPRFDTSDTSRLAEDQLLVYLVDPSNPTQTLLGNGQPGTALFSLAGNKADYTPGLVRYDGRSVEIDLSSLKALNQGQLVFQLLNHDTDTGSYVRISNLTNSVDPDGVESPLFPVKPNLTPVGDAIDLSTLTVNPAVAVQLSNIRFNNVTGNYIAELRVKNQGDAINRQVAVVLQNLPAGVSLTNASGSDGNGNPYITLAPAIAPGGLLANALSDAVELTFSNPNLARLALSATVLSGGPNQAPVLPSIDPLTVRPGAKLTMPLTATDADGDSVTFSLRSNDPLPKGQLDGAGNLIFEPTPGQVGSYEFTLVASDGVLETTQTVSLTVEPDPVTTTRISGQILDTNGNPLVNLPLELGRLQTVTDAGGYFTFTLPNSSFPTEEIDITVPLGDPAFDPFFTGKQFIDLRRTTFDGTTGTSTTNPLRHPNLVTSFLDGGVVYGSNANRANALRTLDGTGRLKVSPNDLLPLNNAAYFPNGPLANENRSLDDPGMLFATGDERANENIALMSMHTVFVREHNRLADEIALANPGLSDNDIYEQARKLVTAQIQHITYAEYLPLLLGNATIPTYTGHNNTLDASVSHLFAASSFRFGHTQAFSEFLLKDDIGQVTGVSVREATFNPRLVQQNGIDSILRGLYEQQTQKIDTKVINELRNTLFGPPGSGGIDLDAVNIQRGRELGLPDYNQARIDFGLAPVTSFADITSDTTIQSALANLYGDVNNIDVFVGGLAEEALPGALVGELLQAVIADQFIRLRDGDKYWYENGQFTTAELAFIRGTTLATLVERNTDITDLPNYVFSSLISPIAPTAGGTTAAATVTDYAPIDGSGHNAATPGTVGSLMGVNYTQEYGDGIRTPGGADRPNARVISNTIFAQDTSIPDPNGMTGFMLIWGQFMSHDLSFTPAGSADTLKVFGDELTSGDYPFVAEKLNLLLGREVYAGVDNVIERPIYLPALDLASNSQTTDANGNTTVTNSVLSASVFVAANTLESREGTVFTGSLSITEVPPDFTPAALPEGLSPDLVVTIQPGDMVFTQPAPLSLPNRAGWAPGTEMDLWSINLNTGDFEVVGTGRVSVDGSIVETVEGGIRNSSWHFFARVPDEFEVLFAEQSCNSCTQTGGFNSEVEFQTGAVIETHALASYQSLGEDRGVQLVYDSLRADARPIVQVGFGEVDANALAPGFTERLRLIAEMTLDINGLGYTVPGYSGGLGLDGGEHFWRIPNQTGPVTGSLQADLRDIASGIYKFDLSAGIYLNSLDIQFVGSSKAQTGQLIHVNTVNSAFGSGWGIAGVQQIVENADGSLLLIDGDGSELLFKAPTRAGEHYQSPPGDFTVFEKLGDGTFQRTTKDQTVYTFDSSNRLISVVDRNGNRTQHIYNAAAQLEKIIDPANLETVFTYNGLGKVETITDPASRITRFQYDGAGNLTKITDPDASQRTFEYDTEHHMTGEIDQRGNREQAFYDAFGRATHAVQKDGSVVRVAPSLAQGLYRPEQTANPNGNAIASIGDPAVTTYADGNGSVSQSSLDAAGQMISAIDGGGFQGSIERNSSNLVTRRLGGRGQETLYTYDERGNLLSVDDEVSRANTPRSDFFTGRITRSNNPSSVVTADINNDGKLDYITTNDSRENGSLSIFYGDGQGNFSGGQPIFGLEAGSSVKTTDLDRDGNTDLIVLERGYGYLAANPSVNILWGDGNGGFDRSPLSHRKSRPYDDYSLLSQGDIDGDGDDDLLVKDYVIAAGGSYQEQVKALFNQGNRTFAEAVLVTGPEYYRSEIQLGDLDGDGDLDAIVQYGFDGAGAPIIQTFLYTGNNTFGTPNIALNTNTYYGLPQSPVWSFDVNQDGNDDVLLLNGSIPNNEAFEVHLSAGDGTFLTPARYSLGVDISDSQVLFEDVNSDGQKDVIAIDEATDQVAVSLSNGQSGFSAAALYDVGDYSSSVYDSDNIDLYKLGIASLKTADIDGNGAIDIVNTSYGDNTVTVLYNDGDGTFSNRVDYQSGQNPAAIAIGDVNQDGQLDAISAGENNIFLENIDGRLEAKFSGSSQADSVLAVNSAFSERAKTLADLNGDGLLDFVGFQNNGDLSIAYGGGGTFVPPLVRSIIGPDGADIEIGDINGDGFQDIVFAARFATLGSPHLKLWILKGDGTADLGTLESIDAGIFVDRLALGDFNGDGKLDVLLNNSSSSKLLLNNAAGTGAFTQVNLTNLPFYSNLLAVGDVNNDGRDEFIWERTETVDEREFKYLSAFSLRPDGSVAVVAEYDLDGGSEYSQLDSFSGSIAAAQVVDLNQDGRQDVVVTQSLNIRHQGTDLDRGYVSVFLAQAGAPAVRVDSPGLYDSSSKLNLGDVNADGQLDVVVNASNRTLLLLGEADGTFKPQNRADYRPLAFSNGAVFLADLDLDGDADLAEASSSELFVRLSNAVGVDAAPQVGARRYTYDAVFNQLTSMTDELGRQTLYAVDGTTGNRLAMTQVVGAVDSAANGETDDVVTSYTYTSNGLVDTITNPLSNVIDYDYNAQGLVTRITFAVGVNNVEAQRQFEYDVAGNLTAFLDENGHRTQYVYDTLNRVVQITEPDPDGAGLLTAPVTSFTYDARGNLATMTDARGNLTQYVYDKQNRLAETVDAKNNRTKYNYDLSGNLISVVDRLGRQVQYQYDSRNRQIAFFDAEGNKTRFQYDFDNNVIATIDPLDQRTTFVYDSRNRLTRQIDALEQSTQYRYDAVNNLTRVTNQNDHATRYAYDDLNRLTQTTDALDGVATFGYDKANNLTSRLDERGNPTAFAYDARNRLTQITDAMGGTTTYTYDGANNRLSTTDELNRTTTYNYDALNRLVQTTDPLNHSTIFGYDANDNLTRVTDALNRTTTYAYDPLNRQVTMVNALGDDSTTTYDAEGNITAVTDELNRTTTFRYDNRNLLTQIIDPLGHSTSRAYDVIGNLSAESDALGNTTQYGYDALYRQTQVIDALGETTQMTYDGVGNLASLSDASGNLTTFTYDALERLETETITVDGQALTRRYGYDATSNVTSLIDRNGRKQAFTYDALNRQTQEQWLDGQGNLLRAQTLTYDAASQLTAASDPVSTYAYTYDLAGRLTSVTNAGTPGVPSVVLSYGYDAVNNLTTVTDTINGVQAGTETASYDALNRVTKMTQSGAGVAAKRVEMAYDAASQMTGLSRYGSLTGTQVIAGTSYGYDLAGRLTDLTHQRGAIVIADYGFTYDAANRLTQLTTPDGTSNYSYNDRYELTNSDHSYQSDEAYNYDATGNRTSYTTGDHNRLLSDGTYSYEYDNEGNRTRRVEVATGEATEYTWDYRNRLTGVVSKDGAGTVTQTVLYAYDVYNRRLSSVMDADGAGAGAANKEHFVYDGSHIALVFDGAGNLTHRYFHGPQIDQVLAEETVGQTRWALGDHQGSVRDVINNTGTVLNHTTYDSFGKVTGESNPALDFRFGYTGRELDEESGLMQYRARYYDPAVGTFVGEDPLGFEAGDANLYRYVFNSPTNFTDPDGQLAVAYAIPLAVVGVAAIVGYSVLQPKETRLTDDDYRSLINGAEDFFQQCLATVTSGYNPDLDSNSPIWNKLPLPSLDWDEVLQAPPIDIRDLFPDGFGEGAQPDVDGFLPGIPSDAPDWLSQPFFESAADLQRGQASEARILDELGLTKNTQRVASPEGYSVPDALTDDISVEIKDTQRVSNTQQIRIQTDAARVSGRTSILITGENTRVSRSAQESFDQIIRRSDLGPQ